MQGFKDSWDDIDSVFSKLRKGVDYKDLESLVSSAEALGIELNIDDFVESGD